MQVEQLSAKHYSNWKAAGYVTKKKRGRLISDEGMKKIDRLSTEVFKDILKVCTWSDSDTPRRM